jgi:osmotically-inducible protein OsmY
MTKRATESGSRKNDAQTRRRVRDEIAWDTRLGDAAVDVDVDGGVVTLTGTASSWAEYLAAQEAAHRTEGVHDVANDLEVELPAAHERADTYAARLVRQTLEWDVTVPHEAIRSTVSKGVVTLDGRVARPRQRDDAARCLRTLTCVREIVNRIRVEGEPDPRRDAGDRYESPVRRPRPRPGARGPVRRPRRLA